MTDELDRLSEEEAARLWQRAAQLQAEAARRQDALPAGDAREEEDSGDDGYRLEHVRAAAVEAGIGGEHLDAALADLRAERTLLQSGRGGRYSQWLLDDPPDAIVVRRVISAGPTAVLRSMERIFPREPYHLTLSDRQGDPLDGGLLVFDLDAPSLTIAVEASGFKGQASAADLKQVLVTLRPIEGDLLSTEVTVRGPVARAHTLNAAVGTGLVGVAAGVGLAFSWPMGGAIGGALWVAGLLAPTAAAAVGAAATALGTGIAGRLGVEGLRAMYDYSLGKGRRALEALVSTLAMEAEGGWGLADGTQPDAPAIEPPRTPPLTP